MRTTFMHYLTEQQVSDVKRLLEELDAQKPNPNDGIDPQAFETGLKKREFDVSELRKQAATAL